MHEERGVHALAVAFGENPEEAVQSEQPQLLPPRVGVWILYSVHAGSEIVANGVNSTVSGRNTQFEMGRLAGSDDFARILFPEHVRGTREVA